MWPSSWATSNLQRKAFPSSVLTIATGRLVDPILERASSVSTPNGNMHTTTPCASAEATRFVIGPSPSPQASLSSFAARSMPISEISSTASAPIVGTLKLGKSRMASSSATIASTISDLARRATRADFVAALMDLKNTVLSTSPAPPINTSGVVESARASLEATSSVSAAPPLSTLEMVDWETPDSTESLFAVIMRVSLMRRTLFLALSAIARRPPLDVPLDGDDGHIDGGGLDRPAATDEVAEGEVLVGLLC